jgi:hypothetical protein
MQKNLALHHDDDFLKIYYYFQCWGLNPGPCTHYASILSLSYTSSPWVFCLEGIHELSLPPRGNMTQSQKYLKVGRKPVKYKSAAKLKQKHDSKHGSVVLKS